MGFVVCIVFWSVAFIVVVRTVRRVQESEALTSTQKSRRTAIIWVSAILSLLVSIMSGNDFTTGYVVGLATGALKTLGMMGGLFFWTVWAPERKARREAKV